MIKMNLWIIIAIAAATLLVFAIVIVMLNQAWGDFPGRIGKLPVSPPPQTPPIPSLSWQSTDDDLDAEEGELAPGSLQTSGLVPVLHPLVHRAVAQALERGGSPYALYFVRDGENLFLNLDRIPDMQTRMRLARTFQTLNHGDEGGQSLPLGEIIRAIGQLGKQ